MEGNLIFSFHHRYTSAIVAITSSKKIMIAFPLPFFLCSTQFLAATVITSSFLWFSKSLKPIQLSSRHLIYQIGVSYTLGFVFTNIAFSIGNDTATTHNQFLKSFIVYAVSASFAETVKSGEPITSIIIGLFYFKEDSSLLTYSTLIPICLGVGVSCVNNDSFNIMGFLAAAASNVFFSTRAVVTKHMFRLHPGSIDEVSLFAHISRIGLFILVPLVVFWEGPEFVARTSDPNFNMLNLMWLVIVNGLAYSCYNLFSFLVLARTDLVTHAVLNVFRRVVIILFTAFYFGVHLSPLNLVGVGMAVAGVLLFGYSKERDKASKTISVTVMASSSPLQQHPSSSQSSVHPQLGVAWQGGGGSNASASGGDSG